MMPYPFGNPPVDDEEQPAGFDQMMGMYGQMAESGPAAGLRGRVAPPQGNWRASPEYDNAAQYQTTQQQWDQNKPWANYEGGAMEWLSEAPEVKSWTEPGERLGKAIGGLIQGRNPLAAAADYDGPSAGTVIVEKFNLPPFIGAALDFITPDPLGASRAADMVPLLGFLLPMRAAFSRGNRGNVLTETITSRNPAADLDAELREPMLRQYEQESPLLELDGLDRIQVDSDFDTSAIGLGASNNELQDFYDAQHGYYGANTAAHQDSAVDLSARVGKTQADLASAYTGVDNAFLLAAPPGSQLDVNAKSIFGTRAISDQGLEYLTNNDVTNTSVYQVINRNLRKPPDELRTNLTPRDQRAFMDLVAMFDGIFDGRFKTTEVAVGYRGSLIRTHLLPVDIRSNPGAMIGQVIGDTGYGSWSDEPAEAFKFLRTKKVQGQIVPPAANQVPYLMQMQIPQGTPAIPMRHTSQIASEQEILFPREMRYRVVDIEPRSKYPDAPAGAVPADDVEYYFMLVEPDFSLTPPVTYRGPQQP